MLGITVPDAIAIGTLAIALLAAWRGTKAGETAAKVTPPEPAMAMIGAALVDRATLQALTLAVQDHAAAIRETITAAEQARQEDITDAMQRMAEMLEQIDRRVGD